MQFHRFVSYIYEYIKGEKENNCGYVKVEQRGMQCVLELHIFCSELVEGSICEIFAYKRENGELQSLLLGQKQITGGRLDCTLAVDAQNIGKAGLKLEDLGGIILKTDQGAFLGTEWDDHPIVPKEFLKEEKEPILEELQIEEVHSLNEPIVDIGFVNCMRISIEDLEKYTYRECALKNNRFLQHGYYNFGHLLLAQKTDGQKILGIPGAYNQQERFMAGMFGFPEFKECSLIETDQGKGGYWYRLIETPDFNEGNVSP